MICPNCGEKSKDSYDYCRHCGSQISGDLSGDFRTDMLNVFKYPDGYAYIYAERGSQVILKSDSFDGLCQLVLSRGFPWQASGAKSLIKKPAAVKAPSPKSEFLKASSLQSPKPAESPREVSDFTVTSLDFSRVRPKRNPSRVREIPESEISTEFGIRGVFRQNGKWAFRTNDLPYTIHDDRLENLQNKVEAKSIPWEIVDSALAKSAFEEDMERIRLRDAEILNQREVNKEFFDDKEKKIRQSSRNQVKKVSDMLKNKNMDNLLK